MQLPFPQSCSPGFLLLHSTEVINLCSPMAGEPLLWFCTSKNTTLHPSSSSSHGIPCLIPACMVLTLHFFSSVNSAPLVRKQLHFSFFLTIYFFAWPGNCTRSPTSPGADALMPFCESGLLAPLS